MSKVTCENCIYRENIRYYRQSSDKDTLYKYGCHVHRRMLQYIESDYELQNYSCNEGSLRDEPIQLELF